MLTLEQVTDLLAVYGKAALEIALLAAVIYYVMLLFRGTRGAAVLTGFAIALFIVMAITQLFQLDVINWILGRFLAFLAIAVLVIFQPELRRALAQLGSQQFFGNPRQRGELIDILVETASALSQKRCGGLLAIEREIGFRGVAETGVLVEARASVELLTTLFHPNTPLHDGGVVLRGDRVVAAGCVFPLTQREGLKATVGMRHRAAIGLSEETDSVVVVVSEETGQISVAQRGTLVQDLTPDGLRAYLATTFVPVARRTSWPLDWVRRTVSPLLQSRLAGEQGGFEEPPKNTTPR
jgi:diadenylate cyclase